MELRPEVSAAILDALTPQERQGAIVYVAEKPLVDGPELTAGGGAVAIGIETVVVFVDPTPLANWSHPARYLLVDDETQDIRSIPDSVPPFRVDNAQMWRVFYKAPDVPDVAVPGWA